MKLESGRCGKGVNLLHHDETPRHILLQEDWNAGSARNRLARQEGRKAGGMQESAVRRGLWPSGQAQLSFEQGMDREGRS